MLLVVSKSLTNPPSWSKCYTSVSSLSILQFINKVIEISYMRKDSCRNCGITMQEFQHCTVCKEVNQFACKQCRRSSDEQVHIECNHIARQLILN
jgi:hypothetical protein